MMSFQRTHLGTGAPRLLVCALAGGLAVLSACAATNYVWQDSPNPTTPFTNWATAAHTIQDAIDAAQTNDTVLVTNGIYATGGRAVYGTMTNRVAVDKSLTLASVNGPDLTIIQGCQATNEIDAIRCVYLTNGASLSGFTLTKGGTRWLGDAERELNGAGVWSESTDATVSNCVLSGNIAFGSGGGAFRSTLYYCTLIRNSADRDNGGGASDSLLFHCTLLTNVAYIMGGGAANSTLNDCRLTSNRANSGGGVWNCTLNNCVLTDNRSDLGVGAVLIGLLNNCTITLNSSRRSCGGVRSASLKNCVLYNNPSHWISNFENSSLNYCCTFPMPADGLGNITNAPLFMDPANGDFRLQSNSPCIDAGNNAYAPGSTDLDSDPRIARLRVDMGAYEYQGPGLSPYIAWLQQYGLPTDGSVDFTDPDSDLANNQQEWLADTNPTNAASVLRINSIVYPPSARVTFPSSAGRLYTLVISTNLETGSWSVVPGAGNIPGTGSSLTLTDTNPPSANASYRVSARLP